MNQTHIEALRLYNLGYHVVPFSARRSVSDASKPLVTDYIKTRPDMSVLVRMYSETDIAIVPQECVVLDLEMKNGLDGVADLTKLAAQNGMTWEQVTNGCFITKTKSNGIHVWYQQPSGERLVGGIHLRPGIEGKAVNGTVHVPPSLGYSASVRIDSPSNLPVLPGFIADAWRACCTKRGEKLDNTVAVYPIGQRRQYLLSYAGTLRERAGCSIEELAALLRLRRDTHCEDPASMSDDEIMGIAKDIGSKKVKSLEGAALAGDPAAVSVMNIINNASDDEPVVILDTPDEENDIPVDMESWCAPTPMFKLFQDWCRKGAIRFQPETNTLAAASTFGCIMGRTYTGHTGMRGNIYAMSILPTGMGKDYPRLAGMHLLRRVGRESSIGASSFGSDSGMITELNDAHEVLWYADEFATAMKAWRSTNCPAYFDNIRKILLECWNGRDWMGKSLKDKEEVPKITSPHPCIMAFCQPHLFSENCSRDMITSGLMGRFLFTVKDEYVFSTGEGVPENECMPEELVDMIKERLRDTNTLLRLQNAEGTTRIGIDPDAISAIKKIDYEIEVKAADYKRTNEVLYALAMRTREKVLRLALIHAWSLGRKNISLDSYQWGMDVVAHSNECVFNIMDTAGGQDEHERTVNSLFRRIKQKPGIGKGRLIGDLKYDEQRFNKAILTLVNGHKITIGKTSKGTQCYFPYKEGSAE